MKIRLILSAVLLCAGIIGVWCVIEWSHSPKRIAVGISKELAGKMIGSSGASFELRSTSFLDSYNRDKFYVVLEFKGKSEGDKLQEVFFFDSFGGKPQMKWNYFVFNNLAKLDVDGGTFIDDGKSQIERRGQECEMQIALTPVDYQVQAETISRLGRQGVEMLVSLEGHPELQPFKIVGLSDPGDCLAEFSSADKAFRCAEILGIKVKERDGYRK